MVAAVSAIGGGIPSGWFVALASSVSGERSAVAVKQETAIVRPIDLRPQGSADGDAWVVLLVGSAFLLVAMGLLFVWLRGRMSRAAIPVRVANRGVRLPSPEREELDPYPA